MADQCLQLFGGYGYMAEYPIARFWTDARVLRIYGGTSEIMKELVARGLLGRGAGGQSGFYRRPLCCLFGEFLDEPLQNCQLVLRCTPAHLNEQFLQVWPGECGIGCPLIAHRADGTKIGWIIRPTHAFIDDMSQMQSGFSGDIVGMGLTCDSTAHLAGEPISIQYKCPGFLGNGALKRRLRFWRFQKILPWLQLAPVIVREYLITLFSTQFPNTASPL